MSNANRKYMWAAKVDNRSFNEAVQRVAFSFGYSWPLVWGRENRTPNCLDAKFICFDPTEKQITWCDDSDWMRDAGIPVYTTLEGMMVLFQNPPNEKKAEKREQLSLFDDTITIYADGSLLVRKSDRTRSFNKQEFSDVLEEIRKFLSGN